MKKNLLFICVIAVALLVGMTSCKNNKKEEPNTKKEAYTLSAEEISEFQKSAVKLNFYDSGYYGSAAIDDCKGFETDFWFVTDGLQFGWNDNDPVYTGTGEYISCFVISPEKCADLYPLPVEYPVKEHYVTGSVIGGWDVLVEEGLEADFQQPDGTVVTVVEDDEVVRNEFVVGGSVKIAGSANESVMLMSFNTVDADGTERTRKYYFTGKSTIIDREASYPKQED
ncbi:MAG: hypothetical protein MJZ95_06275 [Paludibacteraceae bacterium]|nr:hypothetical protein [Paludibacteraceae bacterium]